MKGIKTKEALEKMAKAAEVGTDVTLSAKQNISKVKKRVQENTQVSQESASEYSSEKYESSVETVMTEAGHLVVYMAKDSHRNDKAKSPNGVNPDISNGIEETSLSPTTASQAPVSQPQNKPLPASKSAKDTTVKAADRSIKKAQRTIKTAEETSAVTVKTAQASTQTARKSAEVAAKATVKTTQIAQASAEATRRGLKAAAEAAVKTGKAIITGIKSLVSAIAAGGWVSVMVIVVILLVALLTGSAFGIFFAGEDTGSFMTMPNAVMEINREYTAKIDSIKSRFPYDELNTTGSLADWSDILALYAVKLSSDPTNPTEVVTIDANKKAILSSIFWDMNTIEYRTTTRTDITTEEVEDEDGNITVVEVPITITTLHIHTQPSSVDEMVQRYVFTDEQKAWLAELLQPEYESLWAGVLYGVHNADTQIVAVALSQIGNVGGRPYWSWYGYSSRVPWCACFVSWCADQCGYIDAGIIPKFAGCGYGGNWFIQRGQWADRNYIPQAGDIIFFDWYEAGVGQDGERDHVGIVEKVENGYVYTIEGNSGDKCIQRRYPVGWYEINGYGLPAYP